MQLLPKRPCTYPGCGKLVYTGRCERHKKKQQREQDQRRGSASARGYGARWQKASKAYLAAHPLCMCTGCRAGEIRVMASEVVDHIIPHRGDMKLFWDNSNWQAMSKPCHDRKTASEDGGFGNR